MSRISVLTVAVALLGPLDAGARSSALPTNGDSAAIPPAEQQIAAAVLPAPEACAPALRAGLRTRRAFHEVAAGAGRPDLPGE